MILALEATETSFDPLGAYGDERSDEFHPQLLAAAWPAQPIRFPVAPEPPEQRILAVEFRTDDGRRWNAIGGGPTVAAAIDYAHESCPDDATWNAVRWNNLYGE
jgi:hypothetical protein